MQSKEEPLANLSRGDQSTPLQLYLPVDASGETTDPSSRLGDSATARAEQPALSQLQSSLMAAVVARSGLEESEGQPRRPQARRDDPR